jgi:dienelactone hydrolase
VQPQWLDAGHFWYLRPLQGRKEFVLIDAAERLRRPAFDQRALATALSAATDEEYEENALPFDTFEFVDGHSAIEFKAGDTWWRFALDGGALERRERTEPGATDLVSPDGTLAAFLRDGNLWVREIEGGHERRLTDDAEPYFGYAGAPEGRTSTITEAVLGFPRKPAALWSPDSKRLLTHRLDERGVGSLHLVQSVAPEGMRPILHSYRYGLALEETLPLASHLILNVEDGTRTELACEPRPSTFSTPIGWGHMWWSEHGRSIDIVEPARGLRTWRLLRADARTGAVREILRDESETSIYPRATFVGPLNVRPLTNGDVIWYSFRDGWGHLYRYEASGALQAQLTRGEWTVHEILHVDDERGVLYCTGSGREPERDPYYRHVYRVALDGSGVTLLTPEDADHHAAFAPSGAYFVDRYSRVDAAPVTALRSCTGDLVMPLEQVDLAPLVDDGWRAPQPFSVKSADGAYDLHGVLFRPSTFDPNRSYPIVDYVYPGPQRTAVPKSFDAVWGLECQAVAELGFLVFMLDGRGTPYRSKAFLDLTYGTGFGEVPWLADHVAAIEELGKRHPYIDTNRVGIYGLSAGGFATVRAMLVYPDVFKVGVAMAGNHDQRNNLPDWGETYIGLDEANWKGQSNLDLVSNLSGKLLLMHGEMDDNVHPSQTMRLVDALIAENKDFDMLILPSCNHGLFDLRWGLSSAVANRPNPYALRRLWDYLVRHLLGAEPPAGYRINPEGR